MVFGLGAAIKTAFKIRQNRAVLKSLEQKAALLESEQKEPFFSSLVGSERFDTLLPLLDASFFHKSKVTRSADDKDNLVRLYLGAVDKEFAMAKDELQKSPASRAEVAALGLALREITVTLDREIGALRAKGDDTFSRQASRLAAAAADMRSHLEQRHEEHRSAIASRLAAELSQQSATIEAKATENREALLCELEKGVSEVNAKTEALVQGNHRSLCAELHRLTETSWKELEARLASFSLETRSRLDTIEAKQASTLQLMDKRLRMMESEQASFLQTLSTRMRNTRRLAIFVATAAVIIAAFSLFLHYI